jgi:hypothetical protein
MATASEPVSYLHQSLAAHAASNPVLRRLIEGERLGRLLVDYDKYNAQAVRHRQRYTTFARLALYAATFGTLLGATFLLPIEQVAGPRMRFIGGALQSTALIVSFIAIQWLVWRRLLARWMDGREEAEGRRSEIFNALMRADVPGGADQNDALSARLECFVKCYVDDQLTYFRNRGRQHARAHRNLTPLKLLAYGFGAMSIVIGACTILALLWKLGLPLPGPIADALQSITSAEPHRIQLGLGVFASSLLSFVSTNSLINQHERNAWQYSVIARSLEHILTSDLPAATEAAAGGDRNRVLAFCDKIQDILSVENRTWKLSRLTGGSTPAGTPQLGKLANRHGP